jgi:hypothetical protein
VDLLMQSQIVSNGSVSEWDIELEDGIALSLDGAEELKQRAVIAAFIIKGTIPLLEDTGIDWTGYLLEQVNPRELDAQLRDSIFTFTGSNTYVPYYNIRNGKLELSIKEATYGD